MDNILQPRSKGPIGGVSATRDGAGAMAPFFGGWSFIRNGGE